MNFLRSLDLYKVIVLLSFLVLPLGAWWCHDLDQRIEASRKSIGDATRPGGLLEQIGNLQKKIEVVAQNRRLTSDAINMPRPYFEGQIIAAGGQNLKTDDFGLTDPKVEPAVLGQTKQRADDYVVDVTWQRKDFAVQLDFIYAVLFNCESGAGRAGEQIGRQSIWKLRELQLVNVTDDRLLQSYKTPPPELADKWSIRTMKFARREPRKGP
jgi:hypothetical protein